MSRMIRDRAIVEDAWQLVQADAKGEIVSLPETGPLIVPLQYWLANRDALLARGECVGVWLDSNESPEPIEQDLERLKVVAVNFPKFTDGRGFSTARLLRERYRYTGEVRAIGDVLRDQLFYMARCGFNAFAVRADKSIEDALHAFDDFSETYQMSVERPVPLFRRRVA